MAKKKIKEFPLKVTPSSDDAILIEQADGTYQYILKSSLGGSSTWGAITGTLSAQTDLQNELNAKVTANTAITSATKTKITYDAKGLVTAGTDATTVDVSDTTNKRYVTDAEKTAITHSNRSILDNITEAFTTALKTAYDSSVTWISTNGTNLINHLSRTDNPHSTTKAQVGLSNVVNLDTTTTANITDSTNKRFVTDALLTDTLYGVDYGIVADGVTDNTTSFNSFMSACQAGQYKGILPKGVIVFLSKPNNINFPWDLEGHGLNGTILLRKYNETIDANGLINIVDASGVRVGNMAIESASGQTGGSMVSVISTSAFATSGITLENLWLSTFGSNTQTHTLYIDGSLKVTAPVGVRDVSLKNVHVFGSTSYSVVIRSAPGLTWYGGGVYPAGGSTSLTGAMAIGGVASVKSSFVEINVATVGGLNLTNCEYIDITATAIGDISGVSINNDTTCSYTSIKGYTSGSILTNWLNSFCHSIGNKMTPIKVDDLQVLSGGEVKVADGKVKIGTTTPSFSGAFSVTDTVSTFDFYAQRTGATSYAGVGLQAGTNLFQIYTNAQSTAGNFQTSTVPVANLNQLVAGSYNNNFSLHGSNIYFFTGLGAGTFASGVTSGGALFGAIENMGTTATASVDLIGGTDGRAPLRIRNGVAPTTLLDGLIYRDSSRIKYYDGTTTNQLAYLTDIGSSQILASRIYRNTNQSIPTGASYTDLSWNTSSYQTNGTFWTSGATTTIPETGLYLVTTEATFDGAGLLTIATINMQVEAVVSGVATVIGDDEKQLAIGAKGSLFVLAQRYFTAGDTIKCQVKHSDTGSLNILTQATHGPDIIITKINGAKGDAGVVSTISGTSVINFGQEEGSVVTTILNATITNALFKGASFMPTSTSENSLDDFTLNGVYFNIENIVDGVSFDIRSNSINNASGNYTIKYLLII